jgi:hypothetical protein
VGADLAERKRREGLNVFACRSIHARAPDVAGALVSLLLSALEDAVEAAAIERLFPFVN